MTSIDDFLIYDVMVGLCRFNNTFSFTKPFRDALILAFNTGLSDHRIVRWSHHFLGYLASLQLPKDPNTINLE